MQMLHAATGPNRASCLELLFDTCRTFTPAPFETIGKSAPLGNMPWSPIREHFPRAATHLQHECIQSHIAGASLNSASENLAFGGE
jgi:hypothetical protein